MLDYSKSSIYKIVCNNSGKIYIGSTCQPLHQRLAGHVRSYKQGKYYSSSEIIAGGNYDIILIEEYKCENKNQLLRKEREYIESLECVNICKRPIITIEEGKERTKENRKVYRENNKESIKQYKSQKVICSICNQEMRNDSLTRHKQLIHKPDFTLIE